MIKLHARQGSQTKLVLGLSRANLLGLLKGRPIVVAGSDIGLANTTIHIRGGETEATIARAIESEFGVRVTPEDES